MLWLSENTYQGETIMMTWKQGYEKIQQKEDFLLCLRKVDVIPVNNFKQ